MGLFSELNKSFESPFKVQIPGDVEFCKLADLDINAKYRLVTCYINSKSKFGAHPVAGVIDNDGILLVYQSQLFLVPLADFLLFLSYLLIYFLRLFLFLVLHSSLP